ncbi:hypothetical protein EON67_06535 [archaeon]|nr:MAG: hypothetical protein EON67_06535 [archaeon]
MDPSSYHAAAAPDASSSSGSATASAHAVAAPAATAFGVPSYSAAAGGSRRHAVEEERGLTPEAHAALNSALFALLSQRGVRGVVWDFDLTVLSVHSFGLRLRPQDVPMRNLFSDFRDLPFFIALVHELLHHNIGVAIASFGRYEVIQTYMDLAFGITAGNEAHRIFTRDNIITPASVGGIDGCSLRGGKNSQLELLSAATGWTPEQILFFDGTLRRGGQRAA